jgi:UDP-N-acetylmuramyl tripeptide synthase
MKKSKKKTLRFYLTLAGSKVLIRILHLLGKNATHVPGRKAINICPDFLDQIDKPEYIIAITGTNGKTTVSNLIADVMQDNGYDIVDNRFGGNIDSGIASSFIKNSTMGGHMKKKYAVLEIDERMTTKIFPYVQPDILICTNLFRDSYRRNAHTEFISGILNQTIPAKSKLVLNGEDLISNHLAEKNDRVYFGIECQDTKTTSTNNIINDMISCPKCGTKLNYEYVRYNHIGRAFCPNCDFGSPEMNYAVTDIDYENRQLTIRTPKNVFKIKLLGDNITDAYNTVTAVAALMEFGLSAEAICKSFEKMKIAETRFNCVESNGKKIVMNVAKGQNPIACSRICDFVRHGPGKKAAILIIDDYFDRQKSSENIAWFFDTDMEFLNDPSIKQLVIGGRRCHDMHLRLLMAGVPEEKIVCRDQETDTADCVNLESIDSIYILHDIYTTEFAKTITKRLCERLEKEGSKACEK